MLLFAFHPVPFLLLVDCSSNHFLTFNLFNLLDFSNAQLPFLFFVFLFLSFISIWTFIFQLLSFVQDPTRTAGLVLFLFFLLFLSLSSSWFVCLLTWFFGYFSSPSIISIVIHFCMHLKILSVCLWNMLMLTNFSFILNFFFDLQLPRV